MNDASMYEDDLTKPERKPPSSPTVHGETPTTTDLVRWDSDPIFGTPINDTGGSELDPVPAERYGPTLPTLEERLLAAEDNAGIVPPDPRYGGR